MPKRSSMHRDVARVADPARCAAALRAAARYQLCFDLTDRRLLVRPQVGPPRGTLVLLHGNVPDLQTVLAEGDVFPPGIWGVAGTATLFARHGWWVVCPEQASFWDDRLGDDLQDVVSPQPACLIVAGFSFGGTAATRLVAEQWPGRARGLLLLDPAAKFHARVAALLPRVECPTTVLLAGEGRARDSRTWARACPRAEEILIDGAHHGDMVQPFGILGSAAAMFQQPRRVAAGAALLAAEALARDEAASRRICPRA